ncbi:MAG: histidine--tRNA ligase [Desulfurococcales archaeon]|jgi:histidyl-tRNA synthetase|nr:histidine--tRNA ligase [Desulfurococcales archaeon]
MVLGRDEYMSRREPAVPRGFRDFEPQEMILRKEVIAKIESVFRRYGFDPIDTPAIELFEVLAGKYGEEAESKLMWRFRDPWGDREYALRYDLTVPLARFFAMHRNVPLPFKRYHIAPVWRHEEPQRGRYREFYQCDADIVGSPYPEADAEILMLAKDIYRELGMEGVKILINDRRILRGVFEKELGISDPVKVYRAIDKLDKIGVEGVKKELRSLGISEDIIGKIESIISLRAPLEEAVRDLQIRYSSNQHIIEGTKHLEEISTIVRSRDIVFDMSLVRGLDYYTGPIFEAVVEGIKIGSIGGGGRYDNLIEMFTGDRVPATGFSIGLDRVIEAGIELGIFNISRKTYTDVYVVIMEREKEIFGYALNIVRELRSNGINTSWDLMRRSHQKQREYGRKLSVPIILYIGKAEVESESITAYLVTRGERLEVKKETLVKTIKEMLRA